MLVSEMIAQIRLDLLDDGVKEYLWDDAALLRAINEAQRQACTRGDYLFDTLTLPIAALTAPYPLDPRITRIVRILLDGTEIHRKTRHELDDRTPGWRTATQGETVAVISGRTLTITPIPQTGATLTLEVYRMPVGLEECGQELEIIPEYQSDLKWYCLYLCLSKRDVDTLDGIKAREYLGMFDAIFGKVVPAPVRQHQLQAEHSAIVRSVSYTSKRNRQEASW